MSASDSLLVLRFRDIELERGETIRLHRRIISEFGSCWWGWLYRAHERVPLSELGEVQKQARSGNHLTVALYDTDQASVYVAACTDIQADSRPIRTPALNLTPAYYRNRQAPAWFRFEEIAKSDPSLL